MARLTFLVWMLLCPAQMILAQTDPIDAQKWEGVGILTVENGGACTATLIDSRHILTAAHCVIDLKTNTPLSVGHMVFKTAWQAGEAQVVRRVRMVQNHPFFASGMVADTDQNPFDLAILRLNIPIPANQVRPYQVAPLPTSMDAPLLVVPVAQRQGRGMPRTCPIVGVQRKILVLGCPVNFGASGAPVFRFDLGVPMIVAVISAKAQLEADAVSLASRLHENFDLLTDGLDVNAAILGLN